MKFSSAENMGIQGEWIYLRFYWHDFKKQYHYCESSLDGENWVPGNFDSEDVNIISVKYIGGPKDGQVDW